MHSAGRRLPWPFVAQHHLKIQFVRRQGPAHLWDWIEGVVGDWSGQAPTGICRAYRWMAIGFTFFFNFTIKIISEQGPIRRLFPLPHWGQRTTTGGHWVHCKFVSLFYVFLLIPGCFGLSESLPESIQTFNIFYHQISSHSFSDFSTIQNASIHPKAIGRRQTHWLRSPGIEWGWIPVGAQSCIPWRLPGWMQRIFAGFFRKIFIFKSISISTECCKNQGNPQCNAERMRCGRINFWGIPESRWVATWSQ